MTWGLESFEQDKKNNNANAQSNVIIRDGVIPIRQWVAFKEH